MDWSWERWMDNLEAATQRTRLDDALASLNLEIAQVVTGQSQIGWTLQISGGRINLMRHVSRNPDVTIRCDSQTAQELALGTISSADALTAGRLRIGGRPSSLLAHLDDLLVVQATLAQAMIG